MDEEKYKFDNIIDLVNNEKFDKFAGYFVDKPRNITEVARLSRTSRPTIYEYLRNLGHFKNSSYIKHGILFGGEKLSINIDLLIDYLIKNAKLDSGEKILLTSLLSNDTVKNFVLKWYGVNRFSEIVQRTIFFIMILNSSKELTEEDYITRFGFYNILVLGLNDRENFDKISKGITPEQSKILDQLVKKLLSMPHLYANMFSESLLQIINGYRTINSTLQMLPEVHKRKIKKDLWHSYVAMS